MRIKNDDYAPPNRVNQANKKRTHTMSFTMKITCNDYVIHEDRTIFENLTENLVENDHFLQHLAEAIDESMKNHDFEKNQTQNVPITVTIEKNNS